MGHHKTAVQIYHRVPNQAPIWYIINSETKEFSTVYTQTHALHPLILSFRCKIMGITILWPRWWAWWAMEDSIWAILASQTWMLCNKCSSLKCKMNLKCPNINQKLQKVRKTLLLVRLPLSLSRSNLWSSNSCNRCLKWIKECNR